MLQRQQQQGVSGREAHPPGQGKTEKQLQGNGAAHQLGQVAGNDRHFGQQPQGNSAEPRQELAAGLGQIHPSGDTQPAAERLEHHRHQAGEPYHPQQAISELRSGRQIGGPVARIHVAHGHQVAGAEHPQEGAQGAKAGGHLHGLRGGAELCVRHEAMPAELEDKAGGAANLLGHGWPAPIRGAAELDGVRRWHRR